MIELNESNYKEETDKGLVVVDFYAPWCGPCRMLGPVLEEVEQSENVKVVKVNTDQSPSLATEYNVSALPTVVFLSEGQEVDRFVGLKDKEDIQKQLNELK